MIEGVIVLSESKYISKYADFNLTNFSMTIIGIILSVIILCILVAAIQDHSFAYLRDPGFWGCTAASVFCLILLVILPIAVANMGEPLEYKTEYKVMLDDSVSINKFYEIYEIINVEGKIYTIREKE